MAGGNQVFIGTFIHSKKLDELEYLHDTIVFVDKEGKILRIEQGCDLEKAQKQLFPELGWSVEDVATHVCKDGQFYFPGFIGE
jgi:guanine deaminase